MVPEEAEETNVLAGFSGDEESDAEEPSVEEKGDDDFSGDEAGDDDDEEFTTEKPKATRKRRREASAEGESSESSPAAAAAEGGTRSGRPRGNAFAPMDDQPTADPRVDPYCEINERQIEGKVLEFGEAGDRELYSVTLRKAPTGLVMHARTAVIQVIQFSRGGVARFCAFARWGKGGEEGQKKATEHSYLESAVKKFAEHYLSLTGNDWATRDNGFLKKDGKFEVVEVDVMANVADLSMTSDDRYDAAHPVDEDVTMKLAPELASVVREMCDFGQMYRHLEERGVELGRLPMCRFTKKHVRQAFTALKSLQFILADLPGLDALSEEETAEIVTATYQFFAACPHTDEPAKITSMEQVAYLTETVEILEEVEKISETIRFERTVQTDLHPIDRDYVLFKSKIVVLEEDSSERHLIESMISDTAMPNLDGYKLKVKDVFSLERKGEAVRYAPFTKLHNKQLLWHGAPKFANRSILRDGLGVKPLIAPTLGKTNGITFYDLANPAAQKCGPAPGETAALILAEVALGEVEEKRVAIDDTVEAPAKFFHSLQSMGVVLPDFEKSMDVSGVKWHLGPLKDEHAKLDDAEGLGGQQHYNHFVVNDQSQFCLRYMVTVEFTGIKAPVAAIAAKPTVLEMETETDMPPVAKVTFADHVQTNEDAGEATEEASQLETYSMTQDGPEHSQGEGASQSEASQEDQPEVSSMEEEPAAAVVDASLPTFTPTQAPADATEDPLQTFTASAPPAAAASEAATDAMGTAETENYTLDMDSKSQDSAVAGENNTDNTGEESSDGED